MILTCPNCTTRFLLPVQVLAPDGRKVRCSSCQEMWFQLPDPEELEALNKEPDEEKIEEEVPESIQPDQDNSSVPAIPDEDGETKKSGVFGGAIAAALVFILIGLALFTQQPAITKSLPETIALYEMVGLDSQTKGYGLVFDGLEAIGEDQPSEQETITITGRVINLTADPQSVPMISGAFQDERGKTLLNFMISPPVSEIIEEGMLDFSAEVPNTYKEAEKVYLGFSLREAE